MRDGVLSCPSAHASRPRCFARSEMLKPYFSECMRDMAQECGAHGLHALGQPRLLPAPRQPRPQGTPRPGGKERRITCMTLSVQPDEPVRVIASICLARGCTASSDLSAALVWSASVSAASHLVKSEKNVKSALCSSHVHILRMLNHKLNRSAPVLATSHGVHLLSAQCDTAQ